MSALVFEPWSKVTSISKWREVIKFIDKNLTAYAACNQVT